jgi:uncharacterized protein YgbK (DUF1537 family)
VLADDLTGAMASAVRLRRGGFQASVTWDRERALPPGDAVVVDMRTRDSERSPEREAGVWAARLHQSGCRRYELRIDSTLRGAPALELAGLVRGAELGEPVVVAVPAFPAAGRITVRGRQHVIDGPVSDVAAVVFPGSRVCTVPVETVEAGVHATVEELAAAVQRGYRRFVIDATVDEHLSRAALAVEQLRAQDDAIVTASPGAWLSFFPRLQRASFVLVVLGSATRANRLQLQKLRDKRGHEAVLLSASRIIAGHGRDQIARRIGRARVVVVETIFEPDVADPSVLAQQAAYAAGLLLGSAARVFRCLGVVVTGGHTAASLVSEFGARGLTVGREILPLCAECTVVGGSHSGLAIITKGGAVGSDNTLITLVRAIEERTNECTGNRHNHG